MFGRYYDEQIDNVIHKVRKMNANNRQLTYIGIIQKGDEMDKLRESSAKMLDLSMNK